jgi:hypothetical protein
LIRKTTLKNIEKKGKSKSIYFTQNSEAITENMTLIWQVPKR